MIDYFTREEITNLSYMIISASIRNQGTQPNIVKCNDLYPSSDDAISNYIQLEDKKLFHKTYYRELKQTENIIYQAIIDPILKHRHNIVLICAEREDMYIDVLCDFLKQEFALKTVDLNKLFDEGETDIFVIDKTEVNNKSIEIKRNAVRESIRSREQTPDGRAHLLSLMAKEDKLKKLKSLGIKVDKSMKDSELTELLKDEWVASGE
jgi:hypothetical protein